MTSSRLKLIKIKAFHVTRKVMTAPHCPLSNAAYIYILLKS